jgi:hypothetical protein
MADKAVAKNKSAGRSEDRRGRRGILYSPEEV